MQKIRIGGIVAEYNPFHKGHEWMVQQLRNAGCDTVVCSMSGSFVQRAEPALLPAWLRAKAAVQNGVDLVLRLPLPWAIASAEAFAAGGVGLLAALGCVDTLAFGAESPDTEGILAVAEMLQGESFSVVLKKKLATGNISFASARAAAAEELLPGAGELLSQPNNILAVEYCKALAGTGIQPFAIPRAGAAHDGAPAEGFASASWLRGRVVNNDFAALEDYMPAASLTLLREAVSAGQIIDPGRWQLAMLARLRGKGPQIYSTCPGAGEGLEKRMAAAAGKATSLAQLYTLAKSKRYAHARIRRLALAGALGVRDTAGTLPPFIQVLAASPKGLSLLRKAKEKASLPVSTSLAKLRGYSEAAKHCVAAEAAAEDLYTLCMHTPAEGGTSFTRAAWFSKG